MDRRQQALDKNAIKILQEDLIPLWEEGKSAKEIATELGFGKYPYQNLLPYHVYYYRRVWNLEKRKKGGLKGAYPTRGDHTNPKYL
jgi:hypothetical protein